MSNYESVLSVCLNICIYDFSNYFMRVTIGKLFKLKKVSADSLRQPWLRAPSIGGELLVGVASSYKRLRAPSRGDACFPQL